jgi:hypothetical protein
MEDILVARSGTETALYIGRICPEHPGLDVEDLHVHRVARAAMIGSALAVTLWVIDSSMTRGQM